jgi:hypothetical protein
MFVKAPARKVDSADKSTWLDVQPEWMPTEVEGDPVTGWRAMTERDGSVSYVVGYTVVTTSGLYEADNDGVFYRAAALHPVVAR